MGTYADLKGVHVVGTTGAMVPSLLHHIAHDLQVLVLLYPHVDNQGQLANH